MNRSDADPAADNPLRDCVNSSTHGLAGAPRPDAWWSVGYEGSGVAVRRDDGGPEPDVAVFERGLAEVDSQDFVVVTSGAGVLRLFVLLIGLVSPAPIVKARVGRLLGPQTQQKVSSLRMRQEPAGWRFLRFRPAASTHCTMCTIDCRYSKPNI
jgi:hypothetical protein